MQNKAAVLMQRKSKKTVVTIWVAAEKVKAFERRGFVQVRGGVQEKAGHAEAKEEES